MDQKVLASYIKKQARLLRVMRMVARRRKNVVLELKMCRHVLGFAAAVQNASELREEKRALVQSI